MTSNPPRVTPTAMPIVDPDVPESAEGAGVAETLGLAVTEAMAEVEVDDVLEVGVGIDAVVFVGVAVGFGGGDVLKRSRKLHVISRQFGSNGSDR